MRNVHSDSRNTRFQLLCTLCTMSRLFFKISREGISAIEDYVAKERAADFKKWKSLALFLSPATNAHAVHVTTAVIDCTRCHQNSGFHNETGIRNAAEYTGTPIATIRQNVDVVFDTFNPSGGWAYQGDSVVRHYNSLLNERGLQSLS